MTNFFVLGTDSKRPYSAPLHTPQGGCMGGLAVPIPPPLYMHHKEGVWGEGGRGKNGALPHGFFFVPMGECRWRHLPPPPF